MLFSLYTVRELLLYGKEKVLAKEAEYLLAHAFQKDRLWLLKNYDEKSIWPQIKYFYYVKRCSQGEPLDYILGNSEFFNYIFSVSSATLVPRIESEELLAYALEESYQDKEDKERILDLCCGSACLGISFLLEYVKKKKISKKNIHLDLVDISRLALGMAKKNARKMLWDYSYDIYQSDLLKKIPDKKYNLILCNPPYVLKEEYINLDQSVLKFEPKQSLVIPSQKFEDFFSTLFLDIQRHLRIEGKAFIEINPNLAFPLYNLATSLALEARLLKDMRGRWHFLRLRKMP